MLEMLRNEVEMKLGLGCSVDISFPILKKTKKAEEEENPIPMVIEESTANLSEAEENLKSLIDTDIYNIFHENIKSYEKLRVNVLRRTLIQNIAMELNKYREMIPSEVFQNGMVYVSEYVNSLSKEEIIKKAKTEPIIDIDDIEEPVKENKTETPKEKTVKENKTETPKEKTVKENKTETPKEKTVKEDVNSSKIGSLPSTDFVLFSARLYADQNGTSLQKAYKHLIFNVYNSLSKLEKGKLYFLCKKATFNKDSYREYIIKNRNRLDFTGLTIPDEKAIIKTTLRICKENGGKPFSLNKLGIINLSKLFVEEKCKLFLTERILLENHIERYVEETDLTEILNLIPSNDEVKTEENKEHQEVKEEVDVDKVLLDGDAIVMLTDYMLKSFYHNYNPEIKVSSKSKIHQVQQFRDFFKKLDDTSLLKLHEDEVKILLERGDLDKKEVLFKINSNKKSFTIFIFNEGDCLAKFYTFSKVDNAYVQVASCKLNYADKKITEKIELTNEDINEIKKEEEED